ncbi:acetylornithine deacetylase [Crenobacter sp. SG2303]|uniref:Acetylornithine deacetylase n=1 Tax=Crenobacter oryzisoli TaxID=3056844 RepID=A0ABT7XII3_9NEIS|nr:MULTISPECIES: acetylornithine deacetylase [unclassified Crenobacter]MDN0073588.1 acetylornithine deacetylase [Crenobacter sp. SG2303]MDN0082915.1 acetylornithine deacetylase [Crenobacter sp. SG2305]
MEIRQLLSRLVGFDTTSRLSNRELIDWVVDYLATLGVAAQLSYSEDGQKANLFARVGSVDVPAIVLSGHTDVVPVDGQAWSSEPFHVVERDGRLYGRGTADMKGFIACALALLPEAVARAERGELVVPLALALSYDEEVGCLGVHTLVADLKRRGEKVAGCIVGEPTSMQPVVAHKGIAHYKVCVTGREAHSSLTPLGVNAIEYAARLITFVRELADREASGGRQVALYDVPYTTLQTGLVHGGIAGNIVPRDCEFLIECRWLPGERHERFIEALQGEAERLLIEMRKVAPEASITVENVVHCPAFEADAASEVRCHVDALCDHAKGSGVAYSTEAGVFQQAGIPAVVCGPGSIREAHRPDEYVEIAQLQACFAWMLHLLDRLSRPGH